MSSTLRVSVVMSVYNGADKLPASVESVLSQGQVELELIIVNDGSDSETSRLLEGYAQADRRIRLMNCSNRGLTRSLIEGCRTARYDYLARQDVGDVYLPGKLFKQVSLLERSPAATLVTCGTRFVGPRKEPLYKVIQSSETARQGLDCLDSHSIRGPSHHCSVVCRRRDYEAAGGYRPQFHVAQDLDLWLRLVERGSVIALPEVLLEAEFAPNTISGASRKLQIEFSKILIECAIERRRGGDESRLLQQAADLRLNGWQSVRAGQSEANYFIARMLQGNRDPRCLGYFRAALGANPFNWKALLAAVSARVAFQRWKRPDEWPT